MTTQITTATTPAHFDAAKTLFIEYQQFLAIDLCFQSFDKELESLNTMYAYPEGALLLAVQNNHFIGCVAIRKTSQDSCEMKRLFLQDHYKGQGIGKLLVAKILDEAKKLGYKKIILDTLTRLQPAIALYHSFGFSETGAYYNNPLGGVVYLEKCIS